MGKNMNEVGSSCLDRYLDFNSHHDINHNESTTAILLHRALIIPNTTEGRNRELHKVHSALQSHSYPSKFIHNIQTRSTHSSMIPSPKEFIGVFFKLVEPLKPYNSCASLLYIKGVTQPLTCLLKEHDIKVINRPLKTLQQEFSIPKSRPPLTSQPDVVYKIPCGSCSWNYIGETGRSFATRKKKTYQECEDSGRRLYNCQSCLVSQQCH